MTIWYLSYIGDLGAAKTLICFRIGGMIRQGIQVQFYAGIGLYKSDRSTFSGSLYSANEVPNQIRYTRDTEMLMEM